MRYISIIFISFFCIVLGKNSVRTLTESMGQEVIEISGPKELPPGLDEEPGADSDEDETVSTTLSTTKKDTKKITTLAGSRRNLKDIQKIDGATSEDEESKLEKELAEIYKDDDYKDLTEETVGTKETSPTVAVDSSIEEKPDKPISRSKEGFKFAPDSTSKKDVERFRTSVDDISCKNRQKLNADSVNSDKPNHTTNKFNPFIIYTHLSLILITLACS